MCVPRFFYCLISEHRWYYYIILCNLSVIPLNYKIRNFYLLLSIYLALHTMININQIRSDQISRSVMSDSAAPWIAARQASLSITNSRSSLRLMSIESVMPSSHLILCHPLLLLSIFPSIRVFSNESALCIRCQEIKSENMSIQVILAKKNLKL